MKGLTVRWSLTGVPQEVQDRLPAYVEGSSHARFEGQEGLHFKTWRMRRDAWFEGCYVFASSQERARFQEQFEATAAEAPGSRIVGAPPVLVEPCEIVAVAEGGSGFRSAAAF